MKYKISKSLLMFWCLFIGIGAVYGSSMMLIDPSGALLSMDSLLPYFEVLPFSDILFQNYIFSGIALLCVNGIPHFLAFYFLLKKEKLGIILGGFFGVTLMLWICIQFVIFPFNLLSTSYFIFGLLQALTGYMTYVFYMQDHFQLDVNFSSRFEKKDILVVYFSRRGYTKQIAYLHALDENADLCELTSQEPTQNMLGFLWCGRFAMHKWRMEIDQRQLDLSSYKKVIIVTPIWDFSICAPIRDFLFLYQKQLPDVEYILTHSLNIPFRYVADEMDSILHQRRKHVTSYCIHLGKIIKKYECD